MTHLIERFTEHLKKGKYNAQTIAAYRNAIFVFYNYFRDMPQSKMTDEVIGNYLIELAEKKDAAEVSQAGKAIKLFYEVIFNRKLGIKSSGENKEEKLPEILTILEVKSILYAVKNIKHRCVLLMIYNCGLRISEVLNLQLQDIDLEKNTITVRGEKKGEERILRLAPNTKEFLIRYFRKQQITDVLFPGEGGTAYSSRNVQLFFQAALKKSGVKKEATVHTLRHSFAVHCLEKGMDIHILQQILGHRFLQTTTIYNQLANVNLANLRSPLEDINLLEGEFNFSLD